MKHRRIPDISFIILLALGLAMRTFGAWVYEFAHTSDHGIICLMVKHMLEGKEFPVFFYGLPYMGAIEPSVSALLCALFGLNGFWINMGTALTAFAFLPLVFLWGRGAAGRVGGLAALAFCAIGPPQYFQFESWADGGYAAIPLFTCAVLLMSLRMLVRETEGKACTHGQFLGLGIVAGLGWWQSPLLIPAFLVSGFLFLVVMGKRLFTARLFSGAGGFVIGSLPLWIWNLRNHWQTFDMVKTHDSPSLWQGLKLFYLTRLPDLLELQRQPMFVRTSLAILLLILAGLALARFASAWRAKARRDVLYLGAAILFLIVFSILFGRSRFSRVNALRYVLILIPVLGVLIGAATAWLVQRTRWGLGWLPVIALVALQASALPDRLGERERTAAFIPKAMKLGEFLRAKNIRHLYTDYQVRGANHGLNYLLNEEFVFSPVTRERYRPYARAMEQAENPAVLNNHMGFSSFLKMTGATCESNVVEGMLVQDSVMMPVEGWKKADSLYGGRSQIEDKSGLEMICRFENQSGSLQPIVVSGIRLLCDEEGYPSVASIDAWNESANQWHPILIDQPVTRYFWSGNRFYWGGASFRLECRFKPVWTSSVRVTLKPPRGGSIAMRDLRIMTPDPNRTIPTREDVSRLADWIRSNGVKRVYADRWEANQLLRITEQDVAVSLPPHVYDRATLSDVITLDGQTLLIVKQDESAGLLKVLESRSVPIKETSRLAQWALFSFPENLSPHAVNPCMTWKGCGAMTINDREWALLALKTLQGATLEDKAEQNRAIALAGSALSILPDHRPLLNAYAASLDRRGLQEAADEAKEKKEQVWTPDIPINAMFHGGIELLGVKTNLSSNQVQMKYLWRFPAKSPKGLRVFVHFKRAGKILFQDDRDLPVDLAEGFQPDDVVVETRTIKIPKDVAPGPVQVEMGLYHSGQGGRVRFKGKEQSGKTIRLPDPIVIP